MTIILVRPLRCSTCFDKLTRQVVSLSRVSPLYRVIYPLNEASRRLGESTIISEFGKEINFARRSFQFFFNYF